MTDIPNKSVTFGEWLTFWYETYKKPVLKPYSLRNIEQMIRLHTPEDLKAKRVSEITIFDIDRALSTMPVNRTYVYVRQVWHAAFVKACKYGLAVQNPLDLCDRVRYRKKRGKALTIAEQRDFMDKLENSRYKWIMLFYLYTGVRRTEALNIEWQDIDEADGLILIKGTKTEESQRYILLTDEVKNILENQRLQNKKEGKTDNRVFPYCPETVSRNFKKICPKHHLHDLRHTFITRCCESGVNVNVCQQLVGHSTADMTMNVYTHVMDEFKRKEAAKFNLFPDLK